jgi:hypothetical protein
MVHVRQPQHTLTAHARRRATDDTREGPLPQEGWGGLATEAKGSCLLREASQTSTDPTVATVGYISTVPASYKLGWVMFLG